MYAIKTSCLQQLQDNEFDIQRLEYSRAPPLPRLGEYEEYLNEIRRELGDETRQIYTYPRVGRYAGRQRRSVDDNDHETIDSLDSSAAGHQESKRSLPRFGYRDIPFPRLGERMLAAGRGDDDDDEERSIPFPRLGFRRQLENELNKQQEERALPRYGLRDVTAVGGEKRAMGMLRMGKRDMEDSAELAESKRAMGMLRMGRSMGMLRMGKRAGMSMLRMGRSMGAAEEGVAGDEAQQQKRAMGMLRMGRSGNSEAAVGAGGDSKRAMGMLRMGRALPGMAGADTAADDTAAAGESKDKRGELIRSMRGMSMLRMGKREAEEVDGAAEQQKKNMSLLRMGKREEQS